VQRRGQLAEALEPAQVAGCLAGQRDMDGVVQVVGPDGVHAVPGDQRGLVLVGLGDHDRAVPGRTPGELLEDVHRAGVVEGVDGVEAQPVDAELGHPHLGVVDHVRADEVRPGPVEVDRPPPRGGVAVGEVRPELAQVVPVGAEVVVDDVEEHGQPGGMAGVNEAAEPGRAAVGGMHRVQVDAVVAPAAGAGEGRHRHHLHRRDPERGQVAEPPGGGVEGPLRREGAAVQLVEDQLVQGRRGERRRRRAQVDQPRGAVRAVRLEAGARVGPLPLAIQYQQVVVARRGALGNTPPGPPLVRF
jgi:hypothetical protein